AANASFPSRSNSSMPGFFNLRRRSERRKTTPALPRRSSGTSPRAPQLSVERLEDRHLLSFTNVLVNDTALDTTSRDTQSETALVLGSDGAIIAAYNDSAISAIEPDHTVGYSLSIDGGATFTEGSLPVGGLGTRVDPVLARDDNSGTIYLASLSTTNSAAISVFRSTDNGATFSGPVNGAPGLDSTHDLDKDWLAVDNSTAPGSGQGNVYLVFQDNVDSSNAIYITRST